LRQNSGELSDEQAFQAFVLMLDSYQKTGSLPERIEIKEPRRTMRVSQTTTESPAHPNPWLQKYNRARRPIVAVSSSGQDQGLRFPEPVSYYTPQMINARNVLNSIEGILSRMAERVPSSVRIRELNLELSPYEFTYLMARVYRNIMENNDPGKVLQIEFF